jgi:hypothetical protein
MTLILCVIFFISGASTLVFETLWFNQAGLAFGNSVWTSSLVLAGFMGGLALGSAVAVRRGDRLGPPTQTYAALEVVIAVSGVTLVFLLPSMGIVTTPLLESRFEDGADSDSGRTRRYFALTPLAIERMRESRKALVRLWEGVEARLDEV